MRGGNQVKGASEPRSRLTFAVLLFNHIFVYVKWKIINGYKLILMKVICGGGFRFKHLLGLL
jgi:hypothetical protein